MVTLVVLSALGVNIGPLLAGAGIIGLAVGFGAQTLVRDVASGAFFLMEDAFRKGEYIDIGTVKGTVEAISVRSLRLRHHLGAIHTIPYGEISRLTNYSRDWVVIRLEFRVPYDTDVQKVKKIFKQISAEMQEHPELGKNLLQPFKSQGVIAMEDSYMVMRAKFMAIPGEQFLLRREFYTRIQKAFAENGIEFAHRKVTVSVETSEPSADGSDQSAAVRAAGGAAEVALAEAEAAAGTPPRTPER
jgi:small-conductance mechanosensitive channel